MCPLKNIFYIRLDARATVLASVVLVRAHADIQKTMTIWSVRINIMHIRPVAVLLITKTV